MKAFLFCLLLPCFFLVAEEDFIIISLGESCAVTGILEDWKLKGPSFPFENCITSFHALYESLRDDFCDYTNPDYFTPYIDKQSPVNKYGVVLAHNFPQVAIGFNQDGTEIRVIDPEWRNALPAVQEKYQRRTTRFREACTSGKKVYFVRYLGMNPREANCLADLIHSLYPALDFAIVSIEHEYHRNDPNSPVRHYRIDASLVGERKKEGYKNIFVDLGLVK